MLAVVVGLAEQTKTTSNEEFRRDFVQRIRAMSRAYELVSRENWTDAALDQLVRIEVAPFPAEKVSVSGPTYRLKPKTALALGMVLHELATNSAKHGALSATPGHVAIDWTVRANGDASRLLLRWQEANVANVPKNVTAGFGLRLIEGQVTHTLGGHLAIDARADGLAFQLDLPAEEAATAGSA
jgi:two-component system CheB/CheR fusion protein